MTIVDFLNPKQWLRSDGGPLYVQLRQRLSKGVEQGVIGAGNSLPPEREIANITNLSRVTVRNAIHALAQDGTIIQKQGSGSYVAFDTPMVEQSLSRLTSFSEDMLRRGIVSQSVWLERGIAKPSPEEVIMLALPREVPVSRIARLRSANGRPMAIERTSLSTEMLPNPLLVETSLYETLSQAGLRPIRALQKISAINLETSNAALLEVEPGVAGLRIERTSYLADGRIVEFTQSIYRGDTYNFVAELRLAKE